jgi:Kef-type K+ transport system membrane component KefB
VDLGFSLDLEHNLFYETALVLAVATVVGAIAVRLRQPLIIAFIAVGILVGPAVLDWVTPGEQLELLAEIGIALLLFVVGLKLDLHLIRTMGPVALATGLGQVAFTSIIGFLIALGLGAAPIMALYIAVALTFSSTIIIVKLLSDKREIDHLHGRVALGLLIVQDIVVVLAMIGLSALGAGTSETNLGVEMLLVVVKASLFLAAVGVLMRTVLPRLLDSLARSQELLVLFAIAWAVILAILGDVLGLSSEVGAFLAGVSLATTIYREAIASRLVSLRDFLLFFFFISLGAQLDVSLLGAQVGAAIIFSVFVLIGNPLIVMAIMGFMGYRKRTGFLTGLTVAQISEFSLILAALGLSLGHIDQDTMGLITLVGLITIGLSTYLIQYSQEIYARLAPLLAIFERKDPYRERRGRDEATGKGADVIVYGLGRYGSRLVKDLQKSGLVVHGIDSDPDRVFASQDLNTVVRYGDAEDPEYPGSLSLDGVKWVISTIHHRDVNLTLMHALKKYGYLGRVAVTAHHDADAAFLQKTNADVILQPFADSADRAAEIIVEAAREPGEL